MADQSPAGPAWVPVFLDAMRLGQSVVSAAETAGVDRSTPYSRRQRNAQFAREWRDAIPTDRDSAKPPAYAPRGPQWRKGFLEALAETSNVTASAIAANVPVRTAYKERRKEPEFRAQWYEALLEGYEHLEMETLHRLRMGTAKDEPKFDIANALRLLVLHKETVARERARREARDEDAILASINAKIDAMRAREKEVAQMLAEDDDD